MQPGLRWWSTAALPRLLPGLRMLQLWRLACRRSRHLQWEVCAHLSESARICPPSCVCVHLVQLLLSVTRVHLQGRQQGWLHSRAASPHRRPVRLPW